MAARYMQLKDQTWGIKIEGKPTVGQVVTVQKKDGTTKTESVAAVLFTGPDKQDPTKTISICKIAPRPAAFAEPRNPRRREGATYERGVGYVCDECGERATPGTRCWETGTRH